MQVNGSDIMPHHSEKNYMTSIFKKSFLVTSLAVICLMLGFVGGILAHSYRVGNTNNLSILGQAQRILLDHGLKEVPQNPALEYGMIRGMLQAYDDPYTIFVEPVQHELETNTLQGSFGGIGARISRDEAGNIVLFPLPGSPAATAGVLEGARLLSVEGLVLSPETNLEDVQAALRGEVGTKVTISVGQPPDFTSQQFTLKRAEFSLPSVTWHLYPDEQRLGVVEVNVIAASTPDEILNAVNDLMQRGANAIALDLRDNFGGLLEAGVDIARLFLTQGVVIEQQYKDREVETYKVESKGTLADVPLAVLVNQHTASAAEIIAGALQQQGRAQLIGTSTYGKDTIQLVFDLNDGSSLHVTSARWWVPGMQPPIGEGGLQPDILVSTPVDSAGVDDAMRAAAQYLMGQK